MGDHEQGRFGTGGFVFGTGEFEALRAVRVGAFADDDQRVGGVGLLFELLVELAEEDFVRCKPLLAEFRDVSLARSRSHDADCSKLSRAGRTRCRRIGSESGARETSRSDVVSLALDLVTAVLLPWKHRVVAVDRSAQVMEDRSASVFRGESLENFVVFEVATTFLFGERIAHDGDLPGTFRAQTRLVMAGCGRARTASLTLARHPVGSCS